MSNNFETKPKKIRVLILEDSQTDAEIMVRELRKIGIEPEWERVETESAYLAALDKKPELILADYTLPQFDGLSAVSLLRERGLDTPFILISGAVGEEVAVSAIKKGVDDFLLKDKLMRFGSVVTRALDDKRLRDERKQAEVRIIRLTHLYQALSEVNRAIVRMENQAELFPLVCKCAVEFGGMSMAWIGQLDEANGLIVPVSTSGCHLDFLKDIIISSHANVPEGRGPMGTALRENRTVVINNYFDDLSTLPWRERAADQNWISTTAFPIPRSGKPFAVLGVYHTEGNAFDSEAIALLEEMAKNTTFALDNFDHEIQRKSGEEALRLAASVYETSSEGIMVTDADNLIIAVNPSFTTITGYTMEEVIGSNPRVLNSGPQSKAFFQTMWQDINSTGYWQGEIWNRRRNGDVYLELMTINTVFNNNGSVLRRVAMFTDITKNKASEELIWHQANFDSLTGLPNRQMLYAQLSLEIKKASRVKLPLALLLLDLDDFKEVNDTLGHDIGDALLKVTAQRLTSCVRETDTVARLGGDEFIVILSELDDIKSVERVAQVILQKLAEPFELGNEVAYVSASIGITMYPEDGETIETLIKNADQAMYAAKNQGRNRINYFTKSMQESAQSRMRLAVDLRGALAAHQLWVAYQPIIELATGNIHKAEALLRWQHPVRGLVNPAEFIPIAEETGLINEIGDWVFFEAAQQVKSWRTSYHPKFQISVNKSPAQFLRESCSIDEWLVYMEKLGLPGQSITVEITEGLLLDLNTIVIDKLTLFRDAGIQLSLDDFGTGYSSLAYLKKFHISYLKIDQSFTRNLALGSDDLALCEAIIVMAHKLGLKVIAEGVETEEQRILLTKAGCNYGQGYLWSKPVAEADFEKLLKHNAVLDEELKC